MPDGLDVFNRSVGVDDSVLDPIFRLLPRCIAHGSIHVLAVLWVDSFQERFARRWSFLRIESTNSEHFVGPVKRLPHRRVIGPTARLAEPLCFRQITLAPPQRFFRLLALGDVADGTGDQRALLRLQRTETDLHGKLCAVFTPSIQLQTRTHRPHPRLGEEFRAVFGVSALKSFRHQNLDLLPQEFSALEPKYSLYL